MTPESFASSAEFRPLSRAEKEFVSKYLETGGDANAAVLAAFPKAKSQSLRVLQYRMKNSKRVQAALAAFGKAASEPLIEPKTDDVAAERQKCLQQPSYLAEVLGYELQPEHLLLFEALLDGDATDRLILWPRGSGKSSGVTVAIVFLILRNPNVRIFFTTSDIDMAKRRLHQIADVFDHPTEKFRRLFPEFCGLKNRVRQEFVVRGRTDRAATDPTFSVNTARADSTGLHADWIFIDDLVTFANSQEEPMREQTFQRLQLLRGLRVGNTKLVLTGTTYHSDDAYGRIRKAVEAEHNSRWLISIKSCWSYRCSNCDHKDLWHDEETNTCRLCEAEGRFCPSGLVPGERDVLIDQHITRSGGSFGYTIEGLEHERSEACMGVKNFACQYENDSRPEAAANWPRFDDAVLAKLYGRAL